MEIIKHNKQITKGSVLYAMLDNRSYLDLGDILKVESTIGIDKVTFSNKDYTFYLNVAEGFRFRLAYKNEEKKCETY